MAKWKPLPCKVCDHPVKRHEPYCTYKGCLCTFYNAFKAPQLNTKPAPRPIGDILQAKRESTLKAQKTRSKSMKGRPPLQEKDKILRVKHNHTKDDYQSNDTAVTI
jgi:hypothetical protein